jgi:triacylglycerol lipase
MAAEKTKDTTPHELIPPYPNHPYFTDGDKRQLRFDSGPHAFRHKAQGFEMLNAWWLAEASTLVYSDDDAVRREFEKAGLSKVEPFSRGGTQCFVAGNKEFAVVAFRGTQTGASSVADIGEIVLDIDADKHFLPTPFEPGGKIHRGFAAAVNAVWDDQPGGKKGLKSYLSDLNKESPRPFFFTGHSLGAAAATIAAFLFSKGVKPAAGLYTCGSPLVGDKDFGAAFRKTFPGGAGLGYYRFVNDRDIVPRVPPEQFGFGHVGTLMRIASDGTVTRVDAPAAAPPDDLREMRSKVAGLLNLIKFPPPSSKPPNFLSSLASKLFGLFGGGSNKDAAQKVQEKLDALLLSNAPGPLKDHIPTTYANRIWNAYVKTLP